MNETKKVARQISMQSMGLRLTRIRTKGSRSMIKAAME